MAAYDDLMAFQRETEALGQIAGRLGWDQETVMPEGAAAQRGDEHAALETVLHARRCDPRIADWLEAAQTDSLDDVAKAQLREIRRSFERTSRVPARLAAELARVTSLSQGTWAKARAANSFADFAPTLTQVVALRREEGQALATDGQTSYDALLQNYEPGATADGLDKMFGSLRPGLVDLRDRILGQPDPGGLEGEFDETLQMKISDQLADAFGYDRSRGRIDKAVHPFSSGSGNDVRITTRTAPKDPFNCFYSTIHEVGHATYEQSIDQAYLLTPLGRGASMGVHESQSRIYENQLGRSRAFTGWLFERMRETYGDFGISDAEAFYKAVNRIKRGYIRTEADEVQYNLHVLMRFDLERALVAGSLEVADLEQAWNDRFEADFGTPVDVASNGVLQDVHWPVGLFGYFPTYSIGNLYAGCLFEAIEQNVPDLHAQLGQGDTSGALTWLRDNLQCHGGLYEPKDLITRAIGKAPDEKPLLAYLDRKFGEIYGL